MRTVSFSDARVQDVLNSHFVCCYTDTTGDPSAGASFQHAPGETPGPCGRGAGRQNVQILFMALGGKIFHVAAGYLEPQQLLEEIKFARNVFADLSGNHSVDMKKVATAHRNRLQNLGFQPDEIASQGNMLSEMMIGGPNPQDLGIRIPGFQDRGRNVRGRPTNLFQDIQRQRILKDNQFAIQYPLMTRDEFEKQPQLLVGRHKSFFGSNAAMNGVGEMFEKAPFAGRNRK